MRVLILNDGADTGGGSIKIKKAFQKHAPDWEVRTVRRSDNYIRYPADLEWPGGRPIPEEVLRLYLEADVIHMVNGERLARRLPHYHEKPKVVHYRGRGNDAAIASALDRGIRALVSTPNLLVPGAEWMPNIGDAEELGAVRAQEWRRPTARHPRRPRLVHAPTIRRLKGTDELLEALRPLAQAEGLLDIDIIEGLTLEKCLRRKARGDLLFDQFGPLGGAYGSNAIEAMGMGIPVINMEPSEWLRSWYLRTAGYVPYAEATPDTVAGTVRTLLADPALATDIAERGREFFEQFHEARQVVRRLSEVYKAAVG